MFYLIIKQKIKMKIYNTTFNKYFNLRHYEDTYYINDYALLRSGKMKKIYGNTKRIFVDILYANKITFHYKNKIKWNLFMKK